MNLAVPFNIPLVGQADADAVRTIQFPFGVMITAVTVQPDAFSGTPTGFTVDLNVDGDAATTRRWQPTRPAPSCTGSPSTTRGTTRSSAWPRTRM